MAVGVRQDQLNVILKDMYRVFFDEDRRVRSETIYPKIFLVKTGAGAGDKETELIGLGDLKQHTAEGEDFLFRSPTEGFQYFVNYFTFSDGLALNVELVEDALKIKDMMGRYSKTWGFSLNQAKETFAAKFFNLGGLVAGDEVFNGTHTGNVDPSGDLVFDNKPLFNLAGNLRASKGGATYFNSIAGLILDETTFEQLYNLVKATNNRDELDRPIQNRCDTLLTREGVDENQALRILETRGDNRSRPFVDTNEKNIFSGVVTPISWPFLTDDAFFLGKRQDDGLQFHERRRPDMRFFRDENNAGFRASFRVRWGVLVKDWRRWVRGGGTS